MRFVIALLLALGLAATVAPVTDLAFAADAYAAAEQQPTGQLEVDIDTDGGAWWANPMWIGIGVVALIALIAIIIAASRGGTTVVKD